MDFNFAKVSNFGKVHTVKRECSEAKTVRAVRTDGQKMNLMG